LQRSPLVAADSMMVLLGPSGVVLVSALVALSSFSSLNGSMLAAPRVLFAMGEDGLLFRQSARVHARFKTPYVAILLAAALGIALAGSRTFEALANTFVLAVWPFYALSVAAIYRLRSRHPRTPGQYRVPGYPVVPAIFILSVAGFVLNAFINEPISTGITFALILLGIPVYHVAFRRRTAADAL
jgi:basic amino acid/polyamine antiporter, APA family